MQGSPTLPRHEDRDCSLYKFVQRLTATVRRRFESVFVFWSSRVNGSLSEASPCPIYDTGGDPPSESALRLPR